MTPFRQLSRREKMVEVARWVAMLPAAACGSLAAELAMRVVSGIARPLWFLPYVLSAMAFVVTGSWVAPRRKPAAAVSLLIVSGGLSLLKHVIGQHLAGNRVGTTNSLHAGLEIAGALAGAAWVIWRERNRRSASFR